MKGLKTSAKHTTLPKVPQLPAGSMKGGGGFSLKHKLRKGTEFPGMDSSETGVSDQMADYARMKAAGGA